MSQIERSLLIVIMILAALTLLNMLPAFHIPFVSGVALLVIGIYGCFLLKKRRSSGHLTKGTTVFFFILSSLFVVLGVADIVVEAWILSAW
ncbi:hypothetical protein [Alkalicoccus chagannorensis]|uniref:hypothetical protein n=1 Tax=Alkalicoccus chagannorensis TaxID=427072 RepID=UPI00041E5B59|nr:hypothetical protein [Alkalicoccus chagannorensis]